MDELKHVLGSSADPRLIKTRLDSVAKLRLRIGHSTKPGRGEAAIVCSALVSAVALEQLMIGCTVCRIGKGLTKSNLYLSHSLRP